MAYFPTMAEFSIATEFEPAGDQAQAIAAVSDGVTKGMRFQTLKGVTGSGKTFTMAKIIERYRRPTLVLSHNKTLSAQLYREFKDFFPENAVEYFVSYYDYYQPEAYVAARDLYIEKDASINEEIERLRLSATNSLLERRDVIVVATVSCIYGLGSPRDYREMCVRLECGMEVDLDELKLRLVSMQYKRNSDWLERGQFRVRGDVVDIWPAYAEEICRIALDWDSVERIDLIHPVSGERLGQQDLVIISPARHFVMPEEHVRQALVGIREELEIRCAALSRQGNEMEAHRLRTRTLYDIEMMEEMGFCPGIENYSRHLSGKAEGDRPTVLLDYFPNDFLTFVDESHVTLPQVRAMYAGDRSRKTSLVEHGFRLPSALDNRPLMYKEFEALLGSTIYVSATPSEEELQKSNQMVEQIIRPTGLLDPRIEVLPTEGQIEHLYGEIRSRIEQGERTLITTLTKKMSEDLSDYLAGLGLKVRYMHSDIETIERVEILTDLRRGIFDVLVGINLLREGLDLPEVSLVVILDADKIGFLRSATALIQTIGRAARNINGTVLMYADRISKAMQVAIDETNRRRVLQADHNRSHNIRPYTVRKAINAMIVREKDDRRDDRQLSISALKDRYNLLIPKQRQTLVKELKRIMVEHAKNWEFEEAAAVRDEIEALSG